MATNTSILNTGYGRFRTPVVEVYVGESDGKNMQLLPAQVKKLLEKVELTFTQVSSVCAIPQIVLTFIEGSREPYSKLSKTSELYNIQGEKIQFLSNSTGFLTDLIFDGEGSISSPIQNFNISVLNAIPNNIATFSTESISNPLDFIEGLADSTVSIEPIQIPGKKKYLFKEGNLVKVTVYYAENPQLRMSTLGHIQVVQSEFPEEDHPRLTITCLGTASQFDKITPPKAITYKKVALPPLISPANGKPVYTFQNKSVYEILKETCESKGIRLIVSGDLIGTLQDEDKHFVWTAGKSFLQFMNELAGRTNAYFGSLIDPETNDDVVYFVSKPLFNSYLTITDKNLFTYRANGSILKSVSVKADFASITGVHNAGYDDTGKLLGQGYQEPQEQMVLVQGAGATDTTPKGKAAEGVSSNIKNKKFIGKSQAVPHNNVQNVKDTAKTSTACTFNKTINLEFTSLGHPHLNTGKLYIGGIGDRYSNYYTVVSVTHTVDSGGYVCKATCLNDNLSQGGASAPSAKVIQNATQTESVAVPITQVSNVLSSIAAATSTFASAVSSGVTTSSNPKQDIDKINNK